MARCLAVAISQAAGLSGTPAAGHCSSAATSASWASSSAVPTSRTIRATAAMSRGDSIRHSASIVRWISEAVIGDRSDHLHAGHASGGTLLLLGRLWAFAVDHPGNAELVG